MHSIQNERNWDRQKENLHCLLVVTPKITGDLASFAAWQEINTLSGASRLIKTCSGLYKVLINGAQTQKTLLFCIDFTSLFLAGSWQDLHWYKIKTWWLSRFSKRALCPDIIFFCLDASRWGLFLPRWGLLPWVLPITSSLFSHYVPFGDMYVKRKHEHSLVDGGRYWVTAVLNICVFNWPKKNSNSLLIILDFVAEKSFTICWSGCRVQVHIQVQGPACHLAITPEGYSRRQSKALTENSRAELLGQHYCTAWAGQNGKHKHRVFPSGQQSLWAATCQLEQNMLPLLLYWLSSRAKIFKLCKFWGMPSHFFFNKIFNGSHKTLLLIKAVLIALLNLSIIH